LSEGLTCVDLGLRSRNKTLVQVSSWHADNLGAEDLDFVVLAGINGRLQGLEERQMESNFKAWRVPLDCRSSADRQIFQQPKRELCREAGVSRASSSSR